MHDATSKVDLTRLPPCQSALIPHIQRVNHRVAFYKKADIQIVEKPNPTDDGQGWCMNERGVIEPVWSSGPILPISLVDLLDKNQVNSQNIDDDSEEEIDIDDFLDSDDE